MVKDTSEPLNPSTADFGITYSAVGPLSRVKVSFSTSITLPASPPSLVLAFL
jgi:hypothetical protein